MPARYSIKDLERLSGIKAHTLRIWEQRYEILCPERTDTNIRWYKAEDLKRVLNISLLNRHGYKISRIALMSEKEICDLATNILESENKDSEQIASLVMAMVELNEARFEKIISGNVLRIGFIRTFETILVPFLRKIGVMWQTGSINPAQEHFISNLIRQKLITAIDGQVPSIRPDRKRYLLFLPNNELHELSLLYYHYLIRDAGHESIYLGQSVPLDDIASVADLRKPHEVLTIFTHEMKEQQLYKYLDLLNQRLGNCRFLVSGYQLISRRDTLQLPENMILFNDPRDLMEKIGETV